MWTEYALRPFSRWLLARCPRWMRRKSLFTLLSVSVAVIASAVAAVLLKNDEHAAAGIVVLVGWPLACALDCVDGEIARQDGKTSLAGAVLDAVADVGSFAATGAALVVWLDVTHRSGAPIGYVVALLVGITLWTSAPLGTVGFRAAGTQGSRGKSVGMVKASALRRVLSLVANLFDWSLVQVVFAVLIIWSPNFGPGLAAVYVLATGAAMFLTRLLAFGRMDEWK